MRNRLSLAAVLTVVGLMSTNDVVAQPAEKSSFKLSAKDVTVIKGLSCSLKIDFKGVPVKIVLEFLEDKTKRDLVFIIDNAGLKDAKIDPSEFINDAVVKEFRSGLKVGTFVRMILEEHGMGYYIDDGCVVITSAAKARKMMVVRIHDISGLLDPKTLERDRAELQTVLRMFDSKFTFTTKGSRSAEPSASFWPQKNRLVIRHTLEMHVEIDRVLSELRGVAPAADLSGVDLDVRRP